MTRTAHDSQVMPTPSNPSYLTIIQWPDGSTWEQQVDLVAAGTRIDHATLRLRMKQEPPFIVGGMAPELAAQTVREIRRSGGQAMAMTMSEITALGETHKVRDVRIAPFGVEFEVWRGSTDRIDPATIDVLVLASIATQTMQRRADNASGAIGGHALAGMMIGGPGLAMTLGAFTAVEHAISGASGIDRHTSQSFKLDIHIKPPVAPPRVYQIDGDKFAFGVLGDLKGHSDFINTKKMLELFAHLAPQAVIDQYFGLFKAPSGHHRMVLPGPKHKREDPAFAFYSRWAAIMYRQLLRA